MKNTLAFQIKIRNNIIFPIRPKKRQIRNSIAMLLDLSQFLLIEHNKTIPMTKF